MYNIKVRAFLLSLNKWAGLTVLAFLTLLAVLLFVPSEVPWERLRELLLGSSM